MIDEFSRFSIITENIVIGWLIRFSTPVITLHDLGGKINNDLTLLLRSMFGCLVKTTAGLTPFSNGVEERHN